MGRLKYVDNFQQIALVTKRVRIKNHKNVLKGS